MAEWIEEGKQRLPQGFSESLWLNEFRAQASDLASPLDAQGNRPRKARLLAAEDWDLAATKATASLTETPRIIIKDIAILPIGFDHYLGRAAQVQEVTPDGDFIVVIEGHQFTLSPWEIE